MAKKTRKQRKKKNRTQLNVTPLGQHQKIGKDVLPPFAKLKRELPLQPTDWAGDRLPEMLWAALLIAGLGREAALSRFRRLAKFIAECCKKDESRRQVVRQVTITALALWSDEEFDAFKETVVGQDGALFACLLEFPELPGRTRWLEIAGDSDRSFELLKTAVGTTLFHQSQEATDCRWMRVLAVALSGSMKFPSGATELVRELLAYPDYGDQSKVRPSIRAHEGSIDALTQEEGHVRSWPRHFWHTAFELTRNDHLRAAIIRADQIAEVRANLRKHCEETTIGSAPDPRQETVFGLACYALDLAGEVLRITNASSILGRTAVRTVTEILINLTTLVHRDEPARWQRFRDYGYGQAKLSYLKMLEAAELPAFVSVEMLETFSNEDMWHEFREIYIGNWNDSDLRSMSQTMGLKEDAYDKYYDWSSAFV
jgi:hypothetical protein